MEAATMTNAVESPVETQTVATAPQMVNLDFLRQAAAAGKLDPALVAILQAGAQAQNQQPSADAATFQLYDATFVASADRVLLAIAVKPAGAESVRPKCWITDAEALAILDNADAVRALIGKPVDQRTSNKPRIVESKEKPGAKPSRSTAGKRQEKPAAKPKVDAKARQARIKELVASGLTGADLKAALSAL